MKKVFIILVVLLSIVGCTKKDEEVPDKKEIVLAQILEDVQYPCEEDNFLFLQGTKFMLAPEFSDNGYFGTYEPVGEYTYLATVTYGGDPEAEQSELKLYFTIKDGYVYFAEANTTTIEAMETSAYTLTPYCEIK